MIQSYSNSLISIFIISVVIVPLCEGLKCYQCIARDQTPCNESYLQECPTDQAYDEYSIVQKKTAGGIFEVVRKCVLGPCTLKNRDISLSEKCDMRSNDFYCINCCREDGCNKNSVHVIWPNKLLFYSFLMITLLFGLTDLKFTTILF